MSTAKIRCAKLINCRLCDVIKQNESELANVDFEIRLKIAFNFVCIVLFWASLKWLLYLWNHKINFDGVSFSRINHGQGQWSIWYNLKLFVFVFLSLDSFCLIASDDCRQRYSSKNFCNWILKYFCTGKLFLNLLLDWILCFIFSS